MFTVEELASFELFVGLYACLIGAVLTLRETMKESGHMLWWKAAAIQCALTAFILMVWLTIGFIRNIALLLFGTG
jgi:hypothetical protein